MILGSKEMHSPSAFSMVQSAMIMHGGPHDEGKLHSIDVDKKVEKLPPKPGYITGGRRVTRTVTTRRSYLTDNTFKGPKGSGEFNTAFSEARKRGDKTFSFKGKEYAVKFRGPGTKKSALTVNKSTMVSEMGGIKANPINIKAPTLNKKVPKPNKIIIPPAPIKPKRKPFRPLGKKPFGRPGYKRGAVTKIVRGAGEGIGTAGRVAAGVTLGAVTLPFRAVGNLFAPKCKSGGCPWQAAKIRQKIMRKNRR